MSKYCKECGYLLNDTDTICSECGATVIMVEPLSGVVDGTNPVEPVAPVTPKALEKKRRTPWVIIIPAAVVVIALSFFILRYVQSEKPTPAPVSESASTPAPVSESKPVAKEDPGATPCPEPKCGGTEISNVSVVASHTLKDQASNSYQASNLLDGHPNTVWATRFTGEEETLTFFMNADRLYKIFLVNGYNKSTESFDNNSRAKDLRVYVNGVLAGKEKLEGSNYHWPEYIVLDKEYNEVKEVKIVISSVYAGNKWNDLCISDVSFFKKD